MSEALAGVIVAVLTAYAALGIAFGVFFVSFGVQRLDSEARGTGVAFRLLILPGSAAFWPLLLYRWIRGTAEPPVEKNRHRLLANSR